MQTQTGKQTERQTYRQIEIQTERQKDTDRLTDRQTKRQTDRQKDRQTDKHANRETKFREKGKFPGVTTHKTWEVNSIIIFNLTSMLHVLLVHSDTFVGNEAYMLKGEFLFSIIFKLTR